MASPLAEQTLDELRRLLELERDEEIARHGALLRERGLQAFLDAGLALRDLVGRDEGHGLGGRALVSFRHKREGAPLGDTRLGVGDIVRVAWIDRGATVEGPAGTIAERSAERVLVAFDDPPPDPVLNDRVALVQAPDQVTFRRQVEGLRTFGQAKSRTRVGRLRELLFGEGQGDPRFEPEVPEVDFLDAHLNDSQRHAVRRVLAARDLALVHGPPGTGKTTALVEVLRQARRRDGRVLLVAASNTAVDNVVERLLAQGEPVLRVGHPARVTPALRHATLDLVVQEDETYQLSRTFLGAARRLMMARDHLDERVRRGRLHPADARDERRGLGREIGRLLADTKRMEKQAVEHILDRARIVCTTLTGAGSTLLDERTFDWIVVDEATQATAPAVILALLHANEEARLVLAGDHHQLPPTILSLDAQRQGLGVTLFERAVAQWGDRVRSLLEIQYRMHAAIMDFPSMHFYEGRLHASPSVAGHLLRDLEGVKDVPLTSTPLEWIDTAGMGFSEERGADGESVANPEEAALVSRLVRDLIDAGLTGPQMAVIAPYSAQVRLLRDLLRGVDGIEVGTVDGFQGREKEAVVVSMVRSNDVGEVGFLADVRRMNVAWTRARRKLLVVGDTGTLCALEFYREMLAYVEMAGVYRTAWELQ